MCNKFIRCWFGVQETYVCPRGYLFDTDLMSCRPMKNVYCQDRIDPHEYEDEEEAVLIDPYPGFYCLASKGRFPIQEDCSMYIECKDGESRLYACHPGKLYDSRKETCKPASEVNCNRDGDEETDEDFICPARRYGELFDTDWKSCNNEDQVVCGDRSLPGDDPEDENDENVIDDDPPFQCIKPHGRFTHQDVCNWYYRCKDGKSSTRICRKGRYYDSRRNNCYSYDEVDCGNRRPDEQRPTPKPKQEFVCPSKNGKYPHEKDCGAYYVCEKKKHKLRYCSKGKLYHEKYRGCEDEDKVTCGERIHPDMDPDEPEDDVIDPNPKFECNKRYERYDSDEYCDWYYRCHDKKATKRQCRRGKYYDSRRRKCLDSYEVSCDGRRLPEERTFTTTEEPTTTTTEEPTTTTTEEPTTTTTEEPTTTTTEEPTTTTRGTTTLTYRRTYNNHHRGTNNYLQKNLQQPPQKNLRQLPQRSQLLLQNSLQPH
ncbi:uncharacterized protein TNIN_408992 [Trichonephila inaurata madagascariensis]|uniref:Chitin-binding type-2 domain-containing protein n=1 Tax=Trichonephila inaurata madagascariensis TaxID=2747483 RepID=A0A8X6M9R3_9ARAC|nr:uncharacterized protein TNIN_408992 [Trichonephila inaurata madagascariensis]